MAPDYVEVVTLRVADMNRERMLLRVGKGRKDRNSSDVALSGERRS